MAQVVEAIVVDVVVSRFKQDCTRGCAPFRLDLSVGQRCAQVDCDIRIPHSRRWSAMKLNPKIISGYKKFIHSRKVNLIQVRRTSTVCKGSPRHYRNKRPKKKD
jgi:hypothetical protein